MSTITTRAGKGSPLTNNEVDANFTNLNTDKAELSGAAFTGAITTNSTVDGVDIATRDAILTSTTATADAALPKTGGAMTGAITTNSTFDGRDVATDGTKLDGIEASADVTDATNVTAAGALMDSEVTNLAEVKAFASSDYATAAQGTTADAALPKSGGAMTGAITTNSTFDGRDVATDGTKLDTVETNADVTDATNVTAAGALMDSELTSIASVKALNQGVASTDSPTFAGATLTTADINAGSIDGTAIGASSASTGAFTTLTATGAVTGVNATFTTADNSDNLTLTSTDADANSGPNVKLYRNSSSPADGDNLGFINFYGENDADEETLYGQIRASIADASNGSEDTRFIIQTAVGGTQETSRVELTGTETIINEDSKDLDFRVESDNSTHALFVQGSSGAVGIGASSPSTRLTVGDGVSSEAIKVNAGSGWADLRLHSASANGGSIYFNDGADSGQIFYYHVEDSMRFHTATEERIRIDSSGNFLHGKTGLAIAQEGIVFERGGAAEFTTDAARVMRLNRTSSDGNILEFNKDGAIVGSIGGGATFLTIGSGTGNVYFQNGVMAPTASSSGASSNGVVDLGTSTSRFKDLYLSGNAYLGDGKDLSWGGTYNDGNPTIAASSNFIAFYPEGTTSGEAARIDSSGAMLVNTTSKTNSGTRLGVFADSGSVAVETRCKANVSYFPLANYSAAGAYIGGINATTTATSLATSSDQRLKENIADADDAGSKIDAIQVRKYDWKVDGSHQDYGMVAQELREIIPNVIHESPDEEKMLSVDYAGLVPMLIKEIQSLRNRVAQLEE